MWLFITGIIINLLGLPHVLWSQWPRTHEDDVVELTLRHQEGILLDSILYQAVNHHLTLALSVADTLLGIHTFPHYVTTQLIVNPSGDWADSTWLQNQLLSGDPYLDSLGNVYGLVQVDGSGHYGIVILNFTAPSQILRLAELYETSPLLAYAEPNGYCCDGDDIQLAKLDSVWDFAFSIGRGDCPSGCIYRHYYYVEVETGIAELVLEMDRSFSEPIIYLWNIPPRYAVTMFESADTLIRAITDGPEWWVRRHAVESSWRLVVSSYPWVGEDYDPYDGNSHWHSLKGQLLTKLNELLAAYQTALTDPDLDVGASAQVALDTLTASGLLSTTLSPVLPTEYRLDLPYPNPFNPTTHLDYAIPEAGNVSIVIYDLLGYQVRRLWKGYRSPGQYIVVWDGRNDNGCELASGVYFVRLLAGPFQQTRKVVLLR